MQVQVMDDPVQMGAAAAKYGADVVREAVRLRGQATIVVPTGASQFTMHDALVREPGIDWSRVTVFHLDESSGFPLPTARVFAVICAIGSWRRYRTRRCSFP